LSLPAAQYVSYYFHPVAKKGNFMRISTGAPDISGRLACLCLVLAACAAIWWTQPAATIYAASITGASPAAAEIDVPWNWDERTTIGPTKWASLYPNGCPSGDGAPTPQQSPIDIVDDPKVVVPDAGEIKFTYDSVGFPVKVTNNGYKVLLKVSGKGGIVIHGDDPPFLLDEIHIHTKSEHTIHGAPADFEVHLVHSRKVGDKTQYAAVGVLLDGVDSGGNDLVNQMIANAPLLKGDGSSPITVKPLTLLPEGARYLRYSGSLTNPPCTPVPFFLVAEKKLTANRIGIGLLRRVIGTFQDIPNPKKYDFNNRPLQERRPGTKLYAFKRVP
jgi:carbonic anhydrase